MDLFSRTEPFCLVKILKKFQKTEHQQMKRIESVKSKLQTGRIPAALPPIKPDRQKGKQRQTLPHEKEGMAEQ